MRGAFIGSPRIMSNNFGIVPSNVKPTVMNLKGKNNDKSEEVQTESDDTRQRNQQVGALAVFAFAALFDFFVTHHGVGFWDPSYKL